jgi:hypothetical protein
MHKLRYLAKMLLIGHVLLASQFALSDTETLSWQDLLPELNETLDLDDGVSWGERVRSDLNNKDVRIPGFMVPLEYKEREVVTRFLLVPYFGACYHEPPPPPNQTIYAVYEPGYELGEIWQPIWIEGTISVSRVEEDLATASYSVSATAIEEYK